MRKERCANGEQFLQNDEPFHKSVPAAAIALVKGMEWPAGAVRMVILNEAGGEVHSESK